MGRLFKGGDGQLVQFLGPAEMLLPLYESIEKLYPQKPLLISEAGISGSPEQKMKWFGDFFTALKTKFPAVKAFVWYDRDTPADFSITKNREVFAFFKKYIDGKYFTWNHETLGWRLGSEESD